MLHRSLSAVLTFFHEPCAPPPARVSRLRRDLAMKGIASVALVGMLSLTASATEWSTPRAFSTIPVGLAAATPVTPPAGHGWPEVAWHIDFSDYVGGSIEEWLQGKGFQLEQGA